MKSLYQYGFIDYNPNTGYYQTKYQNNSLNQTKSKVILQSFVQESLHKFNVLSNNSIPTMFLMSTRDVDNVNGVNGVNVDNINHVNDPNNDDCDGDNYDCNSLRRELEELKELKSLRICFMHNI